MIFLLDNAAPVNGSSSMLNGGFPNGFNVEFPMDIEDDASISLVNADFNTHLFQNSEFLDKPHDDVMQSFEQNHFNRMKPENCDNQFLKNVEGNQELRIGNSPMIKSEFPEEMHKSQSNCTKNGLIGNFDTNLFDTLKNNTINNNNNNTCNDTVFLIPPDGKFVKDDSKSLISNLHLPNNYDLFSNGLDNTAMDFESIIPYNDLHSHDSLFTQIPGFDSAPMGRGFGSYPDHNNSLLYSDDTRMSNNESMSCEVENLLYNL